MSLPEKPGRGRRRHQRADPVSQPSPVQGRRGAGGQLEVPSFPHHHRLSAARASPPTPPSSTQKRPPTLCWAINHRPSLSLGPSPGEATPSHTRLKMTVPPPLPSSLTAYHYLWAAPRRVPEACPGLQMATDLCLTSANFGALYNLWLTSWNSVLLASEL